LIWLADQLVVKEIVDEKSEITEDISQSRVIKGLLIARVVIRESPSKMTEMSLRDRDSWAARKAAEASPNIAEQRGLTWVKHLITEPSKSRQTVAWAEKVFWMVVM